MAKTDTISILYSAGVQAKLNEIQAGTISNLQKMGNSFKFKSMNANLSEKAGSYVFKRFANSAEKTYGTARTAGAGDALTAPETTVNVDTHKEIVEEIAKFDAERFGLDASVVSLVSKRAMNHEMTMKRALETDFWSEAYKKAVAGDDLGMTGQIVLGIGVAGTTPIDEYLDSTNFVPLQTVANAYVNGVDRELIGSVVSPKVYSKLKSRINTMYNANFAVGDKEIKGINGVAVFDELYLPKKVESITLVKESVAQPVTIDAYQGERIPLSNDVAICLFYDRGTKALSADLIVVGVETDATHITVTKVAALPTVYATVTETNIYIASTAVTIGEITYAIGDMFTAVKTEPSTITWTQYNA